MAWTDTNDLHLQVSDGRLRALAHPSEKPTDTEGSTTWRGIRARLGSDLRPRNEGMSTLQRLR